MAEAKKETTKKKTTKAEEPAVEVVEVAEVVETTPEVAAEKTPAETKPKATAKAGKRSEKAIKEAEEKEAKEERKAAAKADEEAPKAKPAPKTRSILERKGKKFREVAKLVEAEKDYTLSEALKLAAKTNLMVDPTMPTKDLNALYLYAWEKGVKTLYYQHSMNAAQQFGRKKLQEVEMKKKAQKEADEAGLNVCISCEG
jgi:hypothetical protein